MGREIPLDEYTDYNLVLSGNATAVRNVGAQNVSTPQRDKNLDADRSDAESSDEMKNFKCAFLAVSLWTNVGSDA